MRQLPVALTSLRRGSAAICAPAPRPPSTISSNPAGTAPKRLQALLGHSSIQMTFDTYGHLFPSLEDDQAKFAAGERQITDCQVAVVSSGGLTPSGVLLLTRDS